MSTTVIVDDRSQDLVYNPVSAWIHSTGRAQEFQNTTSYANAAGATMTFTFQGTSVKVYGTNGLGLGTTAAFVVDGGAAHLASTSTNLNTRPVTFHNAFFSSGPLQDGSHTLVMQVTPSGPLSNLLVDYITYTPSPNVPVAHELFFVDDRNSLLNYTGPTRQTDPTATGSYENFERTVTYMPNGTVSQLTFSGTSIQVFGTVPNSALSGPAVSFEIDAAPPSTVMFPPATYFLGSNTDLNVASNYLWYDSGNAPPGTHTLTIKSLMDGAFYLDYITLPTNGNSVTSAFPLVQSAIQSSMTSASPTSTSTSTSASKSSSSTKSKTSKTTKTTSSTSPSATSDSATSTTSAGAIAGGVLGGLVALAIMGVLVLFLIKRRRRSPSYDTPHQSLRPFSGGYTQTLPAWAESRDELPNTAAPPYSHIEPQSQTLLYPPLPKSPISEGGESTVTYNPYLETLPNSHVARQLLPPLPLQPISHPYGLPQHSFSKLEPVQPPANTSHKLSSIPQIASQARQSNSAQESPVYDLASLHTMRQSELYGEADAYGGFA